MLPTLQPKRLYKQIADLVATHIKNGEFAAGSYLPSERDLAQQLGVSRSSVREALIALEVSGLVEIRVGNGVLVCTPEENPVDDSNHNDADGKESDSPFLLMEARTLIEGEVAALAARNATNEQIVGIEETVSLMSEILQGLAEQQPLPDEDLAEADRLFHMRLAEASGNYILVDQVEGLWGRRLSPIFRRIEKHYSNRDLKIQTIEDHRSIVDAIKARDENAARLAMHAHLSHVVRHFSE